MRTRALLLGLLPLLLALLPLVVAVRRILTPVRGCYLLSLSLGLLGDRFALLVFQTQEGRR